jgi:acyl carrier protein
MSESEQNYILKVQKGYIDRFLDGKIPVSNSGLQMLESNCDQIVWELASEIYTQSGHKIDFTIVRDEVNNRIKSLKHQLEKESQPEKEKAARRARQAAEEAERRAHEASIKEKITVTFRAALNDSGIRSQITDKSTHFNGDEGKGWLFLRIREIIADQLSTEIDLITPSSIFQNDLNADSLDTVELFVALEEAFEVEIPVEVAEEIKTVEDAVDVIHSQVVKYLS